MEALIVLVVTLLLLYGLFILPQQRRVRTHQQLVASLQPGDEVILTAGIVGRVVDLTDDEVTFEAAPGVHLRVARQAVLRRVTEPAAGAAGPAGSASGEPNSAAGEPDDPENSPEAADVAVERSDEAGT